MNVVTLVNAAHAQGIKLWHVNGELKLKAPKGALTDEMRQSLAANKEAIIAFLAEIAVGKTAPDIVPVDRNAAVNFPLSFAQERLWFLDQLAPNSAVYNLCGAVVISGGLNPADLQHAFEVVIERHENLRAVFLSDQGEARQRILEKSQFKLECEDLRQLPSDTLERRTQEICEREAASPFDLSQGPLIRAKLLQRGAAGDVLMVNIHHIVSDGWSIGVLIKELSLIMAARVQGSTQTLPALTIQYADYSVWQRRWLEEGGVLERQLAYWRTKLAGVPESVDLATDQRRPGTPDFAGAIERFSFDAALTQRLKRVAEEHGCTLFMILLATFKTLLYRYTGQEDLCVGTPVANRLAGTEGLIGMFVNTLALRDQVDGQDTFEKLLSAVRTTCLEAYEHQDAPFEKVVEAVRPQRTTAINPLFQIMVVLQAEAENYAAGISPLTLESKISKFDLAIDFTDTPAGLTGSLEFSTALYTRRTIARMVRHFTALCRAVTTRPQARIHELDYLGPEERLELLASAGATVLEYPKDVCIHDLFIEQVNANPEAIAVAFGDIALTYRQLYDDSRIVASYLESQGAGPDALVGLCVQRSPDMIVGLMGVLLAGAAYVPLDPAYPDERLAHMIEDSGVATVLTQRVLSTKLAALATHRTRIVTLESLRSSAGDYAPAGKQAEAACRAVRPHHLAYVIYTSGSTGRPKGVAVEHRSLVAMVHWVRSRYSPAELAGVMAAGSICFDLSVYEILPTLCSGGTVILLSSVLGLLERPNQPPITSMTIVPSAMEELLRAGPLPDSIRTINFCAEPLSSALVNKVYAQSAVGIVYDLYGPTENTCLCSYVVRQPNGPQTIGRPIANTQIYILDAFGNVLPIGVPGELHIAGAGLARGYLNQPELTRQRFVANPMLPGTRMYKTGDLARWLDDGTLEYLGRIDKQVKIRGFRVEMGEIEARLNEHADIEESVVVATGEGAEKRLVAFYRHRSTTSAKRVLATDELRAHLQQSLPEHMLPAVYASLPSIPLTPNGKIDRRALERMEVSDVPAASYATPRNDTELRLLSLWAEVLNRDPATIDVNASFFELGGHSLLATRLISKIRNDFARDLPLQALFEHSTIAKMAQLLGVTAPDVIPKITPITRMAGEPLPLSFAQERIWFIDQMEPGNTAYNIAGAVTLIGDWNIDHLELAFNLVIERHENLRTVFATDTGTPHQRILERCAFVLERHDVSARDRLSRERIAKEICEADGATPFDLARGPLIRGKVLKLGSTEQVLMLNMHHIVSDGWSIGVFMKELGAITDAFRHGRTPELPRLAIQYADYSAWQRKWMEEGGMLQQQIAYWQKKLSGIPESLDLVTDYPRPSVQSFAGSVHGFEVPPALTMRLKVFAESQGCTLYMVLLAAFKVLMFRYTGQADICIGCPIANRRQAETEGLIGMFVNTLALRDQLDDADSFVAVAARVKSTCLEAYEHQDAPFEKIVNAVQPHRNMAINPLFQIMLSLQNNEEIAAGPYVQEFPLESGVSKFDMVVDFTEKAGGLSGSVEYSTALYRGETIERMARHYANVLRSIVVNPQARIGEFDYLDAVERHTLTAGNNMTQAEYPRDMCIHELFAERVGIDPWAVAAVYGDEQLSYQELYDRSRELSLYLQSEGVGPDSVVGLCVERSLDMMVGILGIVQAGGAYLPLDPDYPDERLAYMLGDSEASVVLTQERFQERIGGLLTKPAAVVALDAHWPRIRERVAELTKRQVELREEVRSHHISYVIYTSGSTGRPKGVLVEHRALVNRINWMQKSYPLSKEDVVLQKTPYSFDVSVWEFFWPMMSGASVVFAAPDGHRDVHYLERLINQAQVTTLHYVPSMLHAFLDHAKGQCGSVRRIFCSGEALDKKSVDRYRTRFPHAELYNLYGPTEAAIDVTAYDCTKLCYPFVPIGAPIDNTQIYILDRHNNLTPVGVPGELHIAGDGLARGYLNRPELTQEKFIANPFIGGTRMYKTGDLACWLEDGNIQYLGRIDSQVKIRGFRIETSEVEARLQEHPAVARCVVLARGEGADKHLVAFYCLPPSPDGACEATDAAALRTHLQQRLPGYMLPASFVRIDAIPLTASNKVDRRALERLGEGSQSTRTYAPPRNPADETLVRIWADVLKTTAETLGINDDFFELGGNSLSAVKLMARIGQEFRQKLPLSVLFTAPTVAALNDLIGAQESTNAGILVAIQPCGEQAPIFALPGIGGNVLSFRPLSKALGVGRPLYALQAVGIDGRCAPLQSVEDIAAANIAALKEIQPDGPYHLLGHSYGGVVAYEMARVLLEQQEQVGSLVLLDALSPAAWRTQVQGSPDEDFLRVALRDQDLGLDTEEYRALARVAEVNYRCYAAYRPAALARAIPVTLFKAAAGPAPTSALPGDYGWSELFRGPPRIVAVAADHFSILDRPAIHDVAQALLAEMQAPGLVVAGLEEI